MNLNNAIKHYEKLIKENEFLIETNDSYNFSQLEWKKNIEEYKQLVKWLKELKELKKRVESNEKRLKECEECMSCDKDWTKCGTCSVMMKWVKEQREKNENYQKR